MLVMEVILVMVVMVVMEVMVVILEQLRSSSRDVHVSISLSPFK